MHFDWMTFALQIVNFSVLVLLLNRFLYRPVLRAVDKRRAEIEKRFAEAAAAEADAKAKLTALETAHDDIAAERERLLAEADAEARRIADSGRKKAEAEAEALLDDGKRMLAEERGRLLAEAEGIALDLGIGLAGRLLAAIPADAWLPAIERLIRELPEAERGVLAAASTLAAPTVVTAAPLPEAARPEWRERLGAALGLPPTGLEFDTDPALLSGMELRFPSGILRLSGRSGLDSLRKQIEARENGAQENGGHGDAS